MKTFTLNSTLPKSKKSLLLKYAGLFDDPYEWCVLERIYFACNTQPNRKWVCRFSYLMKTTPIKRDQTLRSTLNRLVEKHFLEKVEYGKPIKVNGVLTQRFQYICNQEQIDKMILEMLKKSPTNSWEESHDLVGVSPTNSEEISHALVGYSQEESKVSIEKDNSNANHFGGNPSKCSASSPSLIKAPHMGEVNIPLPLNRGTNEMEYFHYVKSLNVDAQIVAQRIIDDKIKYHKENDLTIVPKQIIKAAQLKLTQMSARGQVKI